MAFFSLLLLAAMLAHLSHSASVNVGIVNGTEAKPHSRPYMVSLQISGKHTCGGFLVTKYFVMTAAHCGTDGKKMTAVIGAHNLKSNDFTRINIVENFVHPNFTGKTPINDIMLLKLKQPIKETPSVACISLPKPNERVKENFKCSVAGWGRKQNGKMASEVLMEANVHIKAPQTCDHWKCNCILCAGGDHHGICEGDSGGPLVCNGTAVGIVAFYSDSSCEHPIEPNGYTDISKFLPWIRGIIYGKK